MGIRNRRLLRASLAALTLLPLLLLPGCGGAKTKSDSLATALAYFPRDAALVVALDTDTESAQFKAIDAVGGKFPGWDGVKRELLTDLRKDEIDFEKDMKPWLGNTAVFGVRTARELRAQETPIMAALVARQGEAAKRFFDKLVENRDMKRAGSYKNAQLYEDPADSRDEDDEAWALSGSVVLLADTVDDLKSMLDVRESGGSTSAEDFDRPLAGLPDDAILRATLDARALVESSQDRATVADAQRVPWVAALSELGMAASVSPTEVELKLRLGTDRRDLTGAQLPLAPDAQTPALDVPADAIWAIGLYDLEHLIRFAENAAKAVQPEAHASYRSAIGEMSMGLGLDIDRDLLEQLTGETALFFGQNGFGLTVGLRDPAKMARTVDKLAPLLPSFLEGMDLPGVRSTRESENGAAGTTYRLSRKGETIATYGVVGDELVVTGGAREPHEVGTGREKALKTGTGALVTVVDVEKLLGASSLPILLDGDLRDLKPISTISGSASNTAQALTAEFKVSIK